MRILIWAGVNALAIGLNVLAAGVVSCPDSTGLETAKWQAKIDAVAAQGGGVVAVGAGVHPVGTLFLRSNVELRLERGAVLSGSSDLGEYPPIRIPYSEQEPPWYAVIAALDAVNVAVTGEGMLEGNGGCFNPKGQHRPRGLIFLRCRNVRVEGVTLKDSASWMCYFKECDGVVARDVRIDNHCNMNNDGFDIESSNVRIENCDVDADDDAICLKSDHPGFAMTNVVIRNCRASSICNALKIGTGTHGTVRGVEFGGCRVVPCRRRHRIMDGSFPGGPPAAVAISGIAVECVDGGRVEDVWFHDIELNGQFIPVFVRLGARPKRWSAPSLPVGKEHALRNVLIENVRGAGRCWTASSLTGVPGHALENVTLRNVWLEMPGCGEGWNDYRNRDVPEVEGGYPEALMFGHILPAYGFYVRHARDVKFENVHVTTAADDPRPAVCKEDVK